MDHDEELQRRTAEVWRAVRWTERLIAESTFLLRKSAASAGMVDQLPLCDGRYDAWTALRAEALPLDEISSADSSKFAAP